MTEVLPPGQLAHDLTSESPDQWAAIIRKRFSGSKPRPLELTTQALLHHATDGALLLLAAYAGIVEGKPDATLRHLKRFTKHYYPDDSIFVGQAIAFAQLGRWPNAKAFLEKHGLTGGSSWFVLRGTGLDPRS